MLEWIQNYLSGIDWWWWVAGGVVWLLVFAFIFLISKKFFFSLFRGAVLGVPIILLGWWGIASGVFLLVVLVNIASQSSNNSSGRKLGNPFAFKDD